MVVHILGKAIRGKYPINLGLAASFYGLGLHTASKICAKLGFYPKMRMHQLTEQQIMLVTKELSEMPIESKLLTQIRGNIALKKKTNSYAGMRHAIGLPVHGQRTKTNAKTARKFNKINRKF